MNSMALFIMSILFLSAQAKQQDLTPGIQCTKDGPLCVDCQTLLNCKKSPNGFNTELIEICDEQSPCDLSTNGCKTGGTCRYEPFSCLNVPDGVHPDPYSCREYHVCFQDTTDDNVCPGLLTFDYIKGSCSNATKPEDCKNLEVCENKGDILLLEGTSYEFICIEETEPYKTLYPKFLTSDALTPEMCTVEGDSPDPADCRGYFHCTPDGGSFKVERRSCGKDEHFDGSPCAPPSCAN
ncbi:hypothetical protein J437_LFUL016103 [Ladona fulva]|uniref:Chitin-binding type-2 domain-containing protein n=1 Tax=Ladona fulva TaxID=123851 RepID=A0A8K0K4A9_LADFU|nr:hypothetical protein J437_LFUL016103 [Ladona fulva]